MFMERRAQLLGEPVPLDVQLYLSDDESTPFPEHMAYLYNIAIELFGRSGASMAGVAPLSWTNFRAWRKENRIPKFAPVETAVIFSIDSILCGTGFEKDDEKKPTEGKKE